MPNSNAVLPLVSGVIQLVGIGMTYGGTMLTDWMKDSPQREIVKQRKIQHKSNMEKLSTLGAEEKKMSEKLPRGNINQDSVHLDHQAIRQRFEAFCKVVTEAVKHYVLIKNTLMSQANGSSISIIFSERGKLIDKLMELDNEFQSKIDEFRESLSTLPSEIFLVFRQLVSVMEEEFISCSLHGLLDKPDLVCGSALKLVDLYREHIAETGSKVGDLFYVVYQRLQSSRQSEIIEDPDDCKGGMKSEQSEDSKK
ncbi:hypothetical protein CAEBREN_20753 [Caenorhabditis brenneri]|uniref:Uncharacterized protein n=1 Tax=Caenorhabditis brenneri TaxID=135651 RepID=G0M9Q2_CAEBE|nr:hypothetical protein CAEBREN_20753 [Caenorhabditis brenneri]